MELDNSRRKKLFTLPYGFEEEKSNYEGPPSPSSQNVQIALQCSPHLGYLEEPNTPSS